MLSHMPIFKMAVMTSFHAEKCCQRLPGAYAATPASSSYLLFLSLFQF